MTFPMQDISKASLVRRIIAWEKKGYEVCHPITEKTKTCRRFKYQDSKIKNRQFDGIDSTTVYFVKMRKVNE